LSKLNMFGDGFEVAAKANVSNLDPIVLYDRALLCITTHIVGPSIRASVFPKQWCLVGKLLEVAATDVQRVAQARRVRVAVSGKDPAHWIDVEDMVADKRHAALSEVLL
jgi:hypothetical protein